MGEHRRFFLTRVTAAESTRVGRRRWPTPPAIQLFIQAPCQGDLRGDVTDRAADFHKPAPE